MKVRKSRMPAAAHARHHVGHHRAQARPGHHAARGHAGEAARHPVHQRADAVGADVAVLAVELGRAGHAEAVHPQPARHDLGLVVEQAHRGCGGLAGLVGEVHGDRVALDRVDVDAVAQLRGERAAGHARAHHHAVEVQRLLAFGCGQRHAHAVVPRLQAPHVLPVEATHAAALRRLGQAVGELVDVAGGVALGVPAAEVAARQRGCDRTDLLGRHGTARQAAGGQQLRHLLRMLEARLVTVDVQDALAPVIKVDAFLGGPGVEVFARGDRQARRLDGVAAVVRDVGNELGKPAQLVPARPRVHQQGRIGLEHPLQALPDRGRVVPHLGIRGRQLAAVGVGGFHRGVAMALEQGDGQAATGQGIGGGDAGDTAADDSNGFHEESSQVRESVEVGSLRRACRGPGAPSVADLRDSRARRASACSFGAGRRRTPPASSSESMGDAGPGA